MNDRVLRFLLSRNSSHVSVPRSRPVPAFAYQLLLRFQSVCGYRSSPRKPGRGRQTSEDRSDGDFIRNLDFGDDGGNGGGDGALEQTRQSIQGCPMNRPNRGERWGGEEEKLFSRQPNETERMRVGSFHQMSDLGRDDSGRSEKTNDSCEDFPFQSSDIGEESEPQGNVKSQASLIQQLRFEEASGVKKAKEDEAAEKLKESEGRDSKITSSDEPILTETSPQDADEIFKKMKETGLIPNAVAMLDGLCKDGLVQDAMKLFGLMREKGTIPEVVIYTAVVEGFCKAAKYDDAKRIFRKMQGNGIVPNAFSYQVIMQGLYKGKRLEDSVEFCMEMVEAGHSPNTATFTGLVNAICKEKGVEGAQKAIRRLRECGLLVDEKAVREHLDKKGPFSPLVQEAIFEGKVPVSEPFDHHTC